MAEFIIDILQSLALLALSLDRLIKTKTIRWLKRQIQQMEPEEQRCGTCMARFNCLAWPGVCYPCPHYIDQDGIEEERRRRAEEKEDAYWATVEVKDD